MSDILYRWPNGAKFGGRIPKEKIYAYGNLNSSIRKKFITEVQKIIWAYKLAEATINLPGSPDVPEVQVFQVGAKASDVSDAVLSAIDRAIPFPIVFELSREIGDIREVRMVVASKQIEANRVKLGGYYTTNWLSEDYSRSELPLAVTLPGLYVALLEPLTPLTMRPGENLKQVTARIQTVRKLEREIYVLEHKLHSEPQFNRKVELLRTLKLKKEELEKQR